VSSTFFLTFNWNLASDPFKQQLFRSRDFRRAVSHLIDRQTLVDLVHSGAGYALQGPVHPSDTFWFHPSSAFADYDPQEAARLLTGLGFDRRDASGYLIDAEGRRPAFRITYSAGQVLAEGPAQVLADVLREAGIDVSLDPVAFPLLVDLIQADGHDRPFEAVIIGVTPGDPAWPFFEALYDCGGAIHVFNRSGECLTSAELLIADLVRRGRTTLDHEAAQALAHEIQDLMAELAPLVYLSVPAAHYVSSGRIGGALPRELWSPDAGTGYMFMYSVR
jgi:peptide/nickel transport system substrate-binding protein